MDILYLIRNILLLLIGIFKVSGGYYYLNILQILLDDITEEDSEKIFKQTGGNVKSMLKGALTKGKEAVLYNKDEDTYKERLKKSGSDTLKPLKQLSTGFKFDEERAKEYKKRDTEKSLSGQVIKVLAYAFFIITLPILPFFFVVKKTFKNVIPVFREILYSM